MTTQPPPDLVALAAPIYAMHVQKLIVDLELAKRTAAANKVLMRQAVRRNRSKLNQRRYRAVQKKNADLLELAITNLRTDVARMEGSIEAMRLAVPIALRTFEPEYKLANEYFRLFGHGFCADPSIDKHQTHVGFLSSVMRDDLLFMGCVGRDKLFDQWTLYVTTFEGFTMELLDLHAVSFSPTVVLHAETKLHLRISRETIRVLLPHLLHHESLVQKMIGRDLHLPLQLRFVFDGHGAVQELGTCANTIGALLDLLGNLDDTLTALGGIHISEDAQIVVASS